MTTTPPGWNPVSSVPPPPPRAERATPRSTGTRRRVTPGGGPRRTSPPTGRAGGSPSPADFTEKIQGFLQGNIAGPLLGAGFALRNRALMADAAVIEEQAGPLASELNSLAQDNPQIAAIIERVTKMGPYGMLLQIGLTVVARVATNHRQELLPLTSRIFGAKPLDQIAGTKEQFEADIAKLFARANEATSPNGSPPHADS
jgi:hypothetical protein